MKRNRHGQAKILTQQEIQLLFTKGLPKLRYRTLYGICLYTACRIREACTLRTPDVYDSTGKVYENLTIRKSSTKGKLATRSIPVLDELRQLLTAYYPQTGKKWLFPSSQDRRKHLHPDSACRLFKEACDREGIQGASTHSFRRTALTQMSNSGIPLRVIQEISGHRSLEQLQRYLEVKPEQVRGAIASLSMLSPVETGELETITQLSVEEVELD